MFIKRHLAFKIRIVFKGLSLYKSLVVIFSFVLELSQALLSYKMASKSATSFDAVLFMLAGTSNMTGATGNVESLNAHMSTSIPF